MSHFVTLLSPEGARYPRLSTADSTDSAVALLSQEPLVQTECLAGKVPRRLPLALHGLEASRARARVPSLIWFVFGSHLFGARAFLEPALSEDEFSLDEFLFDCSGGRRGRS